MKTISVHEIAPRIFKIFALSLPKGLDFGRVVPVSSWMSEDQVSCGLITFNEQLSRYGFFVLRRREDDVWKMVEERHEIPDHTTAKEQMEQAMHLGEPREAVQSGIRRHRELHNLAGRTPCDLFKLLADSNHNSAAWTLNQIYLALPKPDNNFVSDFQTGNLHTRLWELYVFACFREQGLEVLQDFPSPDFHIQNFAGEAYIEAVTANPETPYAHVNARPTFAPENPVERQLGEAAARYAKTLRSKLQRGYHLMPHVIGHSFAIAIADFHAPGSMVWSREALPAYLYGSSAEVIEISGKPTIVGNKVEHLMTEDNIPAGLFRDQQYAHLSAVIHSNAGTISKFNRMGFLTGYRDPRLKMIRQGHLYDRTSGALESIKFELDITSEEYSSLWPDGEEWSTELEIYHNPNAAIPFPFDLLPFATHWFEQNGEVICQAHYKNTVLASTTLITART